MLYTDTQLEALLDDIESDLAERKESWKGDAPEKGRQAVCAFGNNLPGHGKAGVLFVGARDDGTPSGLQVTDALLLTLADLKTDGQTLPPPTLFVEKRRLKGAEMAVVTVSPADAPPMRYKGRIWVRIGPRRGLASAQDERILNERRRHRPWHQKARWIGLRADADVPKAIKHPFVDQNPVGRHEVRNGVVIGHSDCTDDWN